MYFFPDCIFTSKVQNPCIATHLLRSECTLQLQRVSSTVISKLVHSNEVVLVDTVLKNKLVCRRSPAQNNGKLFIEKMSSPLAAESDEEDLMMKAAENAEFMNEKVEKAVLDFDKLGDSHTSDGNTVEMKTEEKTSFGMKTEERTADVNTLSKDQWKSVESESTHEENLDKRKNEHDQNGSDDKSGEGVSNLFSSKSSHKGSDRKKKHKHKHERHREKSSSPLKRKHGDTKDEDGSDRKRQKGDENDKEEISDQKKHRDGEKGDIVSDETPLKKKRKHREDTESERLEDKDERGSKPSAETPRKEKRSRSDRDDRKEDEERKNKKRKWRGEKAEASSDSIRDVSSNRGRDSDSVVDDTSSVGTSPRKKRKQEESTEPEKLDDKAKREREAGTSSGKSPQKEKRSREKNEEKGDSYRSHKSHEKHVSERQDSPNKSKRDSKQREMQDKDNPEHKNLKTISMSSQQATKQQGMDRYLNPANRKPSSSRGQMSDGFKPVPIQFPQENKRNYSTQGTSNSPKKTSHKNEKKSPQELFEEYERFLSMEHKEQDFLKIKNQDWSLDRPEHFEFFFGSNGPFSQHYRCEFEVDGEQYNCAEQYMMHQKAGRSDSIK